MSDSGNGSRPQSPMQRYDFEGIIKVMTDAGFAAPEGFDDWQDQQKSEFVAALRSKTKVYPPLKKKQKHRSTSTVMLETAPLCGASSEAWAFPSARSQLESFGINVARMTKNQITKPELKNLQKGAVEVAAQLQAMQLSAKEASSGVIHSGGMLSKKWDW